MMNSSLITFGKKSASKLKQWDPEKLKATRHTITVTASHTNSEDTTGILHGDFMMNAIE
jgi:hypothetical protein